MLAQKTGAKSLSVQNYQNQLLMTLDFRTLAIYTIKSNKGSQTPGVDGRNLVTESDALLLVERLLDLQEYESKPVRRVNITKSNGKTRPLGIPTI